MPAAPLLLRRSSFHITIMALCFLEAVAVFTQGALAGGFLTGSDAAVGWHEIGGWAAFAIAVVQLLLLLAPAGRVYGLWFLMSAVGIVLGEALQLGSGYGRYLRVHIPLAVVIVAGVTWQILWIGQHRVTNRAQP